MLFSCGDFPSGDDSAEESPASETMLLCMRCFAKSVCFFFRSSSEAPALGKGFPVRSLKDFCEPTSDFLVSVASTCDVLTVPGSSWGKDPSAFPFLSCSAAFLSLPRPQWSDSEDDCVSTHGVVVVFGGCCSESELCNTLEDIAGGTDTKAGREDVGAVLEA